MHFGKGSGSIGDVLDGFAGDDQVKGVCGKGQVLSIALGEGGGLVRGRRGKLGVGDAQSSEGEVTSDDAGTGELKFAHEAAAAAGDLQNVEAGDGAEVFAHQGVPGAGGVFVLRIGVVDALMPGVVGGLEAHGYGTHASEPKKKDPPLQTKGGAPETQEATAAELDAVGNGALHALEEEEAADEDYEDGGGAGE